MSQAVYSFLPWLRQGLGTRISTSGPRRGAIDVRLQLTGENLGGGTTVVPIQQKVELYGPGDIIGIEARAIIRVEPVNGAANFEPNYLPLIEFYDEDYPWRYSPLPAAGERLLPWLTLIVLEPKVEYEPVRSEPGQLLPAIDVTDLALLPPKDDLWAWAHVHVNRDLGATGTVVSPDGQAVANAVKDVLAADPDLGHARIVCPRKLKPNVGYHAFLIPTFETGRLAGLKLEGPVPNALTVAWEGYNGRPAPLRIPFYYEWSFSSGQSGDFEALVRLLTPARPNDRLGVRDLDLRNPGSDLPGFAEPLLKLGGALRVPIPGPDPNDDWDQPEPHPFVVALAEFVNLADDFARGGSADDPVVTAPLYGGWHALMNRLREERDGTPIVPTDNWVHELNLDPRYRVPAGVGTAVVQKHQEDYLKAAWDQVGDILEANRRVRAALFAREVAVRWYARHLKPLQAASADQAFALTGPVHRRVRAGPATVHHQEAQSHLSTTAVSAAFRRITRPRGRLMRRLPFTATVRPDNLLTRMGAGTVRAVPPKAAPPGVLTVQDLAKKFPLLAEECWRTPLPRCPNFRVSAPTPKADFRCDDGPERPGSEATKFKAVLREMCVLVRTGYESGGEAPPTTLDVPGLTGAVVAALNPDVAIPARVGPTIHWPAHLRPERFQEAMAYPRIDTPMYEPLKDLSVEYFLPNIQLVEENTVTLLQTNQKFIEAYMVGLNHEFARELLWREYPTDQRGSYFRQFWSVEDFFGLNDLPPDERREKLYDIPPLHTWPRRIDPLRPNVHRLGRHDHRELNPGDDEAELVLVIRGELLKRYPSTVIYAQIARWDKTGGAFDNKKPRLIDDLSLLTEDALKALPRTAVRTPLYKAKVGPDVYFLGFDLTVDEAKGDLNGPPTEANAGWFFILKERPGEPRFGLDDQANPAIRTVNDLSWPGVPDGGYLPADALADLGLPASPAAVPTEMQAQYQEDVQLAAPAVKASSARWAYLLLQVPVMTAVHAAEMLPK